MSEALLKARARLLLGRSRYTLFNNPQGVAKYPGGHTVTYGLFPGSGDQIGWEEIIITPEMVGQKIARFCSVEYKDGDRGRLSPEQIVWDENVRKAGGVSFIVRSEDDVRRML